jgi:hypothetical protein
VLCLAKDANPFFKVERSRTPQSRQLIFIGSFFLEKTSMNIALSRVIQSFPRGPLLIPSSPFGGLYRCHVVELTLKKVDGHRVVLHYGVNFETVLHQSPQFGLRFEFWLQYHPSTDSISQDAIVLEENFQSVLRKSRISSVCCYEWAMVRLVWRHRRGILSVFGMKHFMEHLTESLSFTNVTDVLLVIAEYREEEQIPIALESARTGVIGIKQQELQSYQRENRILLNGIYNLVPL